MVFIKYYFYILFIKKYTNILKVANNYNKFLELRTKHIVFEYESYSYTFNNGTLRVDYCFNIGENIKFYPKLNIPARELYNSHNSKLIDNIVFHIGMVELISYWKTACPPKVKILCGKLDENQISWWKKLYFNGLGEFFYLNGIDANINTFMDIETIGDVVAKVDNVHYCDKVLVPIGGGKDSVVTMEILKSSGFDVLPMIVNPREASIRTIETGGFAIGGCAIVNRSLDMKLLELNEQGFLNGHTPFSALLAMVNVLVASICGIKYIALSNESSANESTVPGTNINHQYSKSFEFEDDFNNYLSKYIADDIKYFSFLRPLNELQIAKLFAGFPQHFEGFRSCNVGSKKDAWCGKCPKCLFTYIILSPFIDKNELLKIFGNNLLDDSELENIYKELSGVADVKPFECVGTPTEVVSALKNMKSTEMKNSVLSRNIDGILGDEFSSLIDYWNSVNYLPKEFNDALKNAFYEK